LISNTAEVRKIVDTMDQEAKQIKSEVLKMCWYMRGGVTYSEVMNMSNFERESMSKLIKENLETTKKSGLPFF
jgi:predicted CopG family antitoxin